MIIVSNRIHLWGTAMTGRRQYPFIVVDSPSNLSNAAECSLRMGKLITPSLDNSSHTQSTGYILCHSFVFGNYP